MRGAKTRTTNCCIYLAVPDKVVDCLKSRKYISRNNDTYSSSSSISTSVQRCVFVRVYSCIVIGWELKKKNEYCFFITRSPLFFPRSQSPDPLPRQTTSITHLQACAIIKSSSHLRQRKVSLLAFNLPVFAFIPVWYIYILVPPGMYVS